MTEARVLVTLVGLSLLSMVVAGCGAVTGAAVGAASGTAVGVATGAPIQGALIGGGIGAAAGAIYDVTRESAVGVTPDRSVLQTVYFSPNGVSLSEEARAILRRHARWLRANPQMRVRVEGHTDEQGAEKYNLALGARRAEAVKSYLVSLGISQDRLATSSYGMERPVDHNHNQVAWRKNRRVEFRMM